MVKKKKSCPRAQLLSGEVKSETRDFQPKSMVFNIHDATYYMFLA